MRSPDPTKSRAVVAIINHKSDLSDFELISLKQCIRILGDFPIWMIVPQSLDTEKIASAFPSLQWLKVRDKYLSSYRNFNRFKINPLLYRHFKAYDFLLYYELDAFVFQNSLEYWCSLNYDFIGAPWLKRTDGDRILFEGVGNGGFSLRKISSHRKVLKSFRKYESNAEIRKAYRGFNTNGKIRYFVQLLMKLLGLRSNTYWPFNDYGENEDRFWSVSVPAVLPEFRVPAPELALQFSFELEPDLLYKMNQHRLPFGCHAWYKKEQLRFWKPFIEEEGYSLIG